MIGLRKDAKTALARKTGNYSSERQFRKQQQSLACKSCYLTYSANEGNVDNYLGADLIADTNISLQSSRLEDK
jgi:hypothetical protein